MAKRSTPAIPTRFERAVALPGIQPKNQAAHVEARAAFLNLLRDDPAVIAILDASAPFRTAAALAALGDDIAKRAGLPHRAELLASDDETLARVLPDDAAIAVEFAAHARQCSVFVQEVPRAVAAMRPALTRLVASWRLPRTWRWIVEGLEHSVILGVYALLTGTRVRAVYYVRDNGQRAEIPIPTWREGESSQQARRRLDAEYRAALAELQPIRSRAGTQQNPDRIRRDVEIFYRVRVRREPRDSKYRIARDVGVTEKTVRDALTRVEKWFSVRPGGK